MGWEGEECHLRRSWADLLQKLNEEEYGSQWNVDTSYIVRKANVFIRAVEKKKSVNILYLIYVIN